MRLIKEGPYQICKRCIMDTTDPDIVFDKEGICNHCHHYDEADRKYVPKGEEAISQLNKLVQSIKEDGKGKAYDCLIGLSGGVDSSYLAWLVKDLGLRPLAVHLDNGWNSELAVNNVENIVKKLDIDLFTIVIDWEEFRNLQLAYLRSSVVDLEVTSDHAIVATMYRLAKKHKIRNIISGTNVATESILPKAWYYRKKDDLTNLKDINRLFGQGNRIKTYPTMGYGRILYYNLVLKLKWVPLLNYIRYDKAEAKKLIQEKLGWRDYGGKHHESIITKFYQSHILPTKTGFDKRRAHLSNLVCSGQISREQALKEIEIPVYSSEKELKEEKEYVTKKLGITMEEMDDMLAAAPREHSEFKTDAAFRERIKKGLSFLKRLRIK